MTLAPRKELSIIDVHSHTSRGLNLEDVTFYMKSSGVRKIVLFARRGGTDEEILRFHAKYSERVIPTVGSLWPGEEPASRP